MASKVAAAEPPLQMVLREAASVTLARLDGATLTPSAVLQDGDFSECDVVFTKQQRSQQPLLFACASLTHVFIVSAEVGDVVQKIAEEKVAQLAFSPASTFLVTYANPDPKRTDGNMAVYHVATGALVIRCVQAIWPGVEWSFDEQCCVRAATGLLMAHDGQLKDKEPLAKLELQLPQGKEFLFVPAPCDQPLLALFKPFHKQTQASLQVFRLPNIKEEIFASNFGRSEGAASLLWSPSSSANIALTYKVETDKSGATNSYYGSVSACIVGVRDRAVYPINLSAGEGIHDCQWSPTSDELIIVHGVMPRNKATLYTAKGLPVYSFGEAPRNLALWAPNGKMFALGGTGNLVGEFQFYDRPQVAVKGDGKLGYFSEKSSVQTWAPDSRHFSCATIFSRLRIDNKLMVWKHSGEAVCEIKYKGALFGAHWVPYAPALYKARPPSPTKAVPEKAKPQPYRPPVASAGAAALLARNPATATGQAPKPSGPVGGQVVEEKKKKRR